MAVLAERQERTSSGRVDRQGYLIQPNPVVGYGIDVVRLGIPNRSLTAETVLIMAYPRHAAVYPGVGVELRYARSQKPVRRGAQLRRTSQWEATGADPNIRVVLSWVRAKPTP